MGQESRLYGGIFRILGALGFWKREKRAKVCCVLLGARNCAWIKILPLANSTIALGGRNSSPLYN